MTRGVRGVVPPEGNGGGNGTLLIRSRRMVVDGEVRISRMIPGSGFRDPTQSQRQPDDKDPNMDA